jgi:hypothetical protein
MSRNQQYARLKKVHKGILSLDGDPPRGIEEPIISVHPFFGRWYYSEDPYVKRMKRFIQIRKGPIITLEEAPKLDMTIDYHYRIGSKNNRFFLETKERNPTPTEIDWGEFVSYLNEIRQENYVGIIGGSLNTCLAYTTRQLKERGIPIIFWQDLIFS